MLLRNFKCFILLILLCLSSNSFSADEQVESGDLIQVSLPGEDSLIEPFSVNRLGQITLPEVGEVYVAGLTEDQLATHITEKLRIAYRDLTDINVYISKKQLLISVQGYVKEPGEYTLPSDASVQMALQAAGGLRKDAQLNKMQLERNENLTLFNYKHYLDSGKMSLLPPLLTLDKIFVPASPSTGNNDDNVQWVSSSSEKSIYVLGQVGSPGRYMFTDKMRFLDVLSAADGPNMKADLKNVRVTHRNGGNEKVSKLDLALYFETGDENLLPEVKDGDTIFIPNKDDSTVAKIREGLRDVFQMLTIASVLGVL
jgi:protein involved in polysaccharide export with SLBB domain